MKKWLSARDERGGSVNTQTRVTHINLGGTAARDWKDGACTPVIAWSTTFSGWHDAECLGCVTSAVEDT